MQLMASPCRKGCLGIYAMSGLPSLQKCVQKCVCELFGEFDLEFDLKFEISDGNNLVKFLGRTFLPASKARNI